MLHRLAYGTTTIEYRLIYRPRKTLAIHVHADLSVTVEAPDGSDSAVIESKVRKRAAWILKQQRELALYSFEQPPRQYVSGETHHYLGRQYRLKVLQSATTRESVRMSRGQILVYAREVSDTEHVKQLVEGWYRKRAKRVFQDCLDTWLPRLQRFGIERPELTVRRMKSRWGSCTPARKITLNLKLIQMPRDCIEYVIVHELCHMKEPNHSPAFYMLLDKVMPDWRARKQRLNHYVAQVGN